MHRIAIALASTVAALVLLFGYRTSTMGAGTAQLPAVASPAQADAAASASAPAATVVDGPTVDTRWGPVQVQVSVEDGRLVDVAVLQVPDGNHRDREINSVAVPILREEALQAQSADIDVVTGATVTSEGYINSLQAALDEANIG